METITGANGVRPLEGAAATAMRAHSIGV